MLRPDPTNAPASLARPACRIHFGAARAEIRSRENQPELGIALPTLAGTAREDLLADSAPAGTIEGCTIFRSEQRTAGFAVAADGDDLAAAARDLYQRVFAASRGQRLYRVWNYVPHINAVEGALENYRRFCRGRSLAFEEHFGPGFQRQLPAGSAVGSVAGPLAVAFLAGDAMPRHFENPVQTPAFEYPAAYGPRPPSFSRATLVATPALQQVFISGTAAIRGHVTVSPDALAGQLPCTMENLAIIAETAGAGPAVGAAQGWQRSFKIYVRHRADFAAVRSFLDRNLLRPADEAIYLHADLCRSDLRVEIEGVLSKSA
jgi:chorismate lyase / 3-hydroxybenzoate synthase